MKIKLLLLMSLLFFVEISFAQNTVTYSSLNNTINLNSGVEGTVDVLVNCYGSSSTPVFLNATQSCGNNDGILSSTYTNGSTLTPGQNTIIRYKFKKTVTTDTQIIYKFSTDGSCFQDESKMIKITVNYKAAIVPAPTPILNNSISGNQTIEEGQTASTISGSSPSGGNGSFSYQWQKKVGTASWAAVSGASGIMYSPGILTTTTSFRRIVISGTFSNTSNAITVTVIPTPPIENNTITLSGSEIQGSTPTGGTGSFTYRWYTYILEGEGWQWMEYTTKDWSIPSGIYQFMENLGNSQGLIFREVRSGNKISDSNVVTIYPAQPIQNNTITLSGNDIIGSLPTGGTGTFRYEYYSYLELPDGEIEGPSMMPGSDQNYMLSGIPTINIKYYRRVVSGNKSSQSNIISFPLSKSVSSKESLLVNNKELTVYPNPTSESINFSTTFSTEKDIEIIVYSEILTDTKSVFKGRVIPNQIVNWNIPSNYSKGIYFYKILSGNNEVKSGKFIFR